MDGVLVVDKPVGPTSHDVVYQAKRLLHAKVGHTGTLDPLASGVLPLLIGRATRLARFFQCNDKEYVAEIELGTDTDTCDREGNAIGHAPVPEMSQEELADILSEFQGEIRQRPPLYSAIKVQGRKLYELARSQVVVTPPERTVEITLLEILGWDGRTMQLRVRCSAGTYIRSLARDVGEKIGCGGFLSALQRTRSGGFHRSEAVPLTEVAGRWQDLLIPLDEMLPELARVDLDAYRATRVRHGNAFTPENRTGGPYCRLFDSNHLIAIGQPTGDLIQPVIVLAP